MPRDNAARTAGAYALEGRRKPPPSHLNREAKALWRQITADRPADFFRPGSYALLSRYCALHAEAVRLEAVVAGLAEKAPADYKAALELLVKVTAAACTVATKLRLGVQHDYRRDSRRVAERRDADQVDDDLLAGEESGWAFPTTGGRH